MGIISILSPKQVMTMAVAGVVTFFVVGITACVALIFAALWVLVHFALVTLQACQEMSVQISSVYATSDPLLKFVFLFIGAYVLYHFYKKVTRKGAIR